MLGFAANLPRCQDERSSGAFNEACQKLDHILPAKHIVPKWIFGGYIDLVYSVHHVFKSQGYVFDPQSKGISIDLIYQSKKFIPKLPL